MKLYCAFKVSQEIEDLAKMLIDGYVVGSGLTHTPLDRLHVTTAFLGEMPLERGVEILKSAWQTKPFTAAVVGVGTFPKVLHLDIVAAGAVQVRNNQMVKYLGLTGKSLHPAVYTSHLTLGKFESAEFDVTHLEIQKKIQHLVTELTCTVDRLGLYCKSELLHEVVLQP